MQITKQDIRNLRKSMGLAAHDITKVFDCTERTVYNKERPGHEPGDIVWYYALLWMEHREQMSAPLMVDAEYVGAAE